MEYIEEVKLRSQSFGTLVKTAHARDFFRKVAERTLEECRFSFLRGKEINLNAIAVSENKIRKLNRTYLGRDAVTDILSFSEYATCSALAEEKRKAIFLGEIFFCPMFIAKRAERDLSREVIPVIIKTTKKKEAMLKWELAYIFSHGVLHLVGFDHEEEMFAIQEKVADLLEK